MRLLPLGILALALLSPARLQARDRVLHRFRVLRPGPVVVGRPLPLGGGELLLLDPLGKVLPLQVRAFPHPPAPGCRWRWTRLAWKARRSGIHRLLLRSRRPGKQAGGGPPSPGRAGWLPPFLLWEGRPCRGKEETLWTGPVLSERIRSGWGPPGSGFSWRIRVQFFSGCQTRLSFRVVRFGRGAGPLPSLEVPLPKGPWIWQVLSGGGRTGRGGWRPFPPGFSLEEGQALSARLLGREPSFPGGPPPFGWGDQPGEDPDVLCRLPLPGAPPLLLPAGRGGLGSQDRALEATLLHCLEEARSWKDPRDRGDLKDRSGAWTNLEFDPAWALVLHYLRRGDPLFLEGARLLLEHSISTDRAWIDRPGETAGLFLVHGRRHRGNGTETGHVWIQGLLGTALLTGDPDLLAAAETAVSSLTLAVQDRGMGRASRCLGWTGLALGTWLQYTSDRSVARALGRLAQAAARSWEPRAGAFLLPGDRMGTRLWKVPLWVQAGLLGRLVLQALEEGPWPGRCRLLLRPARWKGRDPPSTLFYREGGRPRPGGVSTPAMTALALEGTAWICGGTRAWRSQARRLARGLEKALRKADGREAALLGRAWPVLAGRILSR